MMGHADTLESRLFRCYWDDGLLDLLAGVAVVGIGVFWAFDLVAVGAVVPAVVSLFWVPLRRALVEPRTGHVEFSDARMGRTRRLGLGSLVLGLAMLALFVGSYFLVRSRPGGLLPVLAPGLPAVLLGIPAALAGLGLGLPRFLAYAGALCLAGFGVALADARPEVAMIAGGIVMVAGGAWRLHRLFQLPVEHMEEN